jgi:hypothetical protein
MTRTELNSEAQRLVDAQMDVFRAQVRNEMDFYIQYKMSTAIRSAIGTENPLAGLDAWWASLSEADQQAFKEDYFNHRFNLLEFQQRMSR